MRFALAVLMLAAALPAARQTIPKTAVKPDSTHATFILPADLKWKKESLGQLQAPLYGDPDKPGPYGILIKWPKGEMSHPHFHTTDRFAYVVSGTWWVSTARPLGAFLAKTSRTWRASAATASFGVGGVKTVAPSCD